MPADLEQFARWLGGALPSEERARVEAELGDPTSPLSRGLQRVDAAVGRAADPPRPRPPRFGGRLAAGLAACVGCGLLGVLVGRFALAPAPPDRNVENVGRREPNPQEEPSAFSYRQLAVDLKKDPLAHLDFLERELQHDADTVADEFARTPALKTAIDELKRELAATEPDAEKRRSAMVARLRTMLKSHAAMRPPP